MFCIIFALFEVRCACVNKYHQISNLYMAKKCSYVWTMRRTTPIEVRVVFFLNDEILLVFDFELSVQGKITFIGLCTHTHTTNEILARFGFSSKFFPFSYLFVIQKFIRLSVNTKRTKFTLYLIKMGRCICEI